MHSLQENTRITPNCWTAINNNNKMLEPTNTPCVCCCTQLGLTLCEPMDSSPPASFVHEISQARIMAWVAISYSRGSSWPRDWTCVSCISCIGRQILYHCTTWQAQYTRIVLIRIRFCLLHPGIECIPTNEWLHEANHGYLQKTKDNWSRVSSRIYATQMTTSPFHKIFFCSCELEENTVQPLWCWERLKAGGEGDNRGWDCWMASPIWIWTSPGSWCWTGKPGVLQSMGSQRVGHHWVVELNWWSSLTSHFPSEASKAQRDKGS